MPGKSESRRRGPPGSAARARWSFDHVRMDVALAADRDRHGLPLLPPNVNDISALQIRAR
jgi:hypothetical protein